MNLLHAHPYINFKATNFVSLTKPILKLNTIVISLLLSACVVGPDYVAPKPDLPKQWHNSTAHTQALDAKALANWWTTFNDSQLSQLIERSINGNFDLKKALARIHEARAQRGIAKADYFPKINASGSTGETYNGNTDERNAHYSLGLDASWEIDIFGRISRSVESAQAAMEATEASYQDVMVSLIAEVALNYVQMRTSQAQLIVAEQNLIAQTEIYQLALWRWQAGLNNKLDAEQALSSVEQLTAQLPNLKNQIIQNQHQLAVLLGVNPTSLNAELAINKPIPTANLKIAVGVPADVLRQRPDIRLAERELAAQTAQIGVATAALYPKFALSGLIGLESIKASTLFTAAGLVDSVLGKVTFPIFNAGALRQNIEVQNAKQEQALANYETVVLTALKDVENALVGIVQEQQRLEDLNRATQTAQRAMTLARQQYESGLVDFQNVQQTQRTLLSLQEQSVSSQGQVTTYLISLYKALGGGWKNVSL
ncbi:MAG: efflux transporter outer membrane subunit [Methylococcaceae bacterium]|nr:efflux transporter outer membrane subunit [Methylococcaceae bacterium]